jgi:hypothetical protein
MNLWIKDARMKGWGYGSSGRAPAKTLSSNSSTEKKKECKNKWTFCTTATTPL